MRRLKQTKGPQPSPPTLSRQLPGARRIIAPLGAANADSGAAQDTRPYHALPAPRSAMGTGARVRRPQSGTKEHVCRAAGRDFHQAWEQLGMVTVLTPVW